MRILFPTANRVGDAVLSTGILNLLAANIRPRSLLLLPDQRRYPVSHYRIYIDRRREKRYGARWLSSRRDCVAGRWDILST